MRQIPEKIARSLYRRLVLNPAGRGWPIEVDTWDDEYDGGDWDYLFDLDEMAHHMVVLGYVNNLHANPKVLEMGCGSGRFLDLMRRYPFESFLGVDLSKAAIERAKTLGVDNAEFAIGSFDDFHPGDRKFDIIVFDEVIWYADKPYEVLERFLTWLTPTGKIVMSMYDHINAQAIWRRLERRARVVDATRIEHNSGKAWDVKVFEPRR